MSETYRCPKCGSENTVWAGYRHNKSGKKRLRKCNECGHRFTPDDGFLRMRFPKEVIVEAVSLYMDGLSLSKVQKHMWQHHEIKVSRWTILKWARKYSELLQQFPDKLEAAFLKR